MADFISGQGVYESPVSRPTPDFGTKCPELIEKADGFFSQKSK